MIKLIENDLYVDTYLKIRDTVGWKKLSQTQAKKALDNSLFTVVAIDDATGEVLGMGRIVGDGAVICYVQDLVIIPGHQGKGVGRVIVNRLIDFVKSIQEDGTEIMLALMCAKGREAFYEKMGFMARPTSDLGPGMIQYLKNN